MSRQRAQSIIIRNNSMLFGYGYLEDKGFRHFFIGGGVKDTETTYQAALRELKEEANVDGRIIFKFEKELKENYHTFLVDIGKQDISLGYDPEQIDIPKEQKNLQKLIWLPLDTSKEFTDTDIEYFKLLIEECKMRNYHPEWLDSLESLVAQ